MTAYAELQVTSNFSFLRGGSHPEELVLRAAELGLAALALTDRNTLAGVVRAHVAAKEVGIRFVVGARLDLMPEPTSSPSSKSAAAKFSENTIISSSSPGIPSSPSGLTRRSRLEVERAARNPDCPVKPGNDNRKGTKPGSEEGQRRARGSAAVDRARSLLCFPTGRAAYGRLSELISLGQRRAEKGHCQLGLEDVLAHAEGQILVVLAPERIDGEFEVFLKRLRANLKDPCYLAAQHLYRGDDGARIEALAALAAACGTPLVATGDVLYHTPARRRLQDVLTCIREHCTIDEAGYRLEANAERHLKPGPEMARLFAHHPEALARTLEITDACRFSLDELRYEYPIDPAPAGMSEQAYLEQLTWAGAAERYPGGIPGKVKDLLEHEFALIAELGYVPYFLTVYDIVRFARSRGILCQGRGSAANSAVCYCLGVTAVDPERFDLLFERFVSAERNEPPDIDVDFEHERREEVIQYVYEKYGREHAGIAATVIHYRSRSAIREVGKALGLSEDAFGALASGIWGWSEGGLDARLARERGLDPTAPRLRQALELAGELVGFPRHLSQHVGGFVLTRSRLDQVVPVVNAAMAERTMVEWDKDDLDALGILKIDVLALGMLTCVRKAFELIERHYGRKLDLASVPPEDPAVYEMLSRADSLGVFQVESRAQMTMLPRLKPRCFYDLVIEVAIVRPGPIQGDMVHPYLRRRSGLEPVDYPSAALKGVLEKTLGVPLFQEQAMQIAIVGAGFTPSESDRLRRAMATFKRVGTIHTFRDKFIDGMVANGYERAFAERCFQQIEGFGTYGFPESHAASFALLVYVSSWLKRHYPDVFACALLNSQPMGFYAPAQIVRDARDHGVTVLPVDVNRSDWDCTLEPESPSAPAAPPPASAPPKTPRRDETAPGSYHIHGLGRLGEAQRNPTISRVTPDDSRRPPREVPNAGVRSRRLLARPAHGLEPEPPAASVGLPLSSARPGSTRDSPMDHIFGNGAVDDLSTICAARSASDAMLGARAPASEKPRRADSHHSPRHEHTVPDKGKRGFNAADGQVLGANQDRRSGKARRDQTLSHAMPDASHGPPHEVPDGPGMTQNEVPDSRRRTPGGPPDGGVGSRLELVRPTPGILDPERMAAPPGEGATNYPSWSCLDPPRDFPANHLSTICAARSASHAMVGVRAPLPEQPRRSDSHHSLRHDSTEAADGEQQVIATTAISGVEDRAALQVASIPAATVIPSIKDHAASQVVSAPTAPVIPSEGRAAPRDTSIPTAPVIPSEGRAASQAASVPAAQAISNIEGRADPCVTSVAASRGAAPLVPSVPATPADVEGTQPKMEDGRGGVAQRRALRLGLRQVKGLKQAEMARLVAERVGGWRDLADLRRRAGVSAAALDRLARADAFQSMTLDRRGAIWRAIGLDRTGHELDLPPLFAWAEGRTAPAEPGVALPRMTLGQEVAEDYANLRLSLRCHRSPCCGPGWAGGWSRPSAWPRWTTAAGSRSPAWPWSASARAPRAASSSSPSRTRAGSPIWWCGRRCSSAFAGSCWAPSSWRCAAGCKRRVW